MNTLGEINRIDTHDQIFDALVAYRKLVLLFHSGTPWTHEKQIQWIDLQRPIMNLTTAGKIRGESMMKAGYIEATTKGLCDLGRAIA